MKNDTDDFFSINIRHLFVVMVLLANKYLLEVGRAAEWSIKENNPNRLPQVIVPVLPSGRCFFLIRLWVLAFSYARDFFFLLRVCIASQYMIKRTKTNIRQTKFNT